MELVSWGRTGNAGTFIPHPIIKTRSRYYGGKKARQTKALYKLIEVLLTAMSDAFRNQMNDSKMKYVPFEDCFDMLLDINSPVGKTTVQKVSSETLA